MVLMEIYAVVGVVGQGPNIENCINEGIVYGNGRKVGGIIGTLMGGTASQCVNRGIVQGIGFTGGIVGSTNVGSKVMNCVNNGTIRGENVDTGGILGCAGKSRKQKQSRDSEML